MSTKPAEKPKYTEINNPWQVTEFKEAYLYKFLVFHAYFEQFLDGYNNLEDPKLTRRRLTSKMYTYYVLVAPFFNERLADYTEAENPFKVTKDDYLRVLTHPQHYPDKKIIAMASVLTYWNSKHGFGRLADQERIYANMLDQFDEEMQG